MGSRQCGRTNLARIMTLSWWPSHAPTVLEGFKGMVTSKVAASYRKDRPLGASESTANVYAKNEQPFPHLVSSSSPDLTECVVELGSLLHGIKAIKGIEASL